MTEAQKRSFVRQLYTHAARLGVEDIEPDEIVTAVNMSENWQATAQQAAEHLWGKPPQPER